MIVLSEFGSETVKRLNLSRRTGVYFIRNIISDKIYIGSAARNFSFRFRCHANNLRYGNHHNKHLQSAWNQYGPKSFECGVVEDCHPDACVAVEQKWLDFFKPEYNFCRVAGSSLGMRHTDESKRKTSVGNKGKKRSHDFIENLRVISSGRKHSEVTRLKMSRSSRRLKMSDEHKEKLIKINTGRKKRIDEIEASAEKNRGQKRTPEFCARISAALKGRSAPWMLGVPMKEEVKAKIAKARTGKRNTPETIARMCDAQKLWRSLKKENSP